MCKNKIFQSFRMKNELFKVQREKTKFIYEMKVVEFFNLTTKIDIRS